MFLWQREAKISHFSSGLFSDILTRALILISILIHNVFIKKKVRADTREHQICWKSTSNTKSSTSCVLLKWLITKGKKEN